MRVLRFDAITGGRSSCASATRRPFTLERDADGRVVAARRGERVVRYAHDAEGRPLSITDADGRVTRFTRDAAGRLASVTDDLGRTNRIDRDDESRVTERASFGADGELIRSVGFLFDAQGRLASTTERRADAAGATGTPRTARARSATTPRLALDRDEPLRSGRRVVPSPIRSPAPCA